MTATLFQCFKAYEESTRYYKQGNAVIFRSVYHYAELEYFKNSKLPLKSIDGNYYQIPNPDKAEIGNVYLERVEFQFTHQIAEETYKKQLSEIGIIAFEQLIILLGYSKEIYQVMYGKGTVAQS